MIYNFFYKKGPEVILFISEKRITAPLQKIFYILQSGKRNMKPITM